MKVERTLISKAIFYYTNTGKTEAALNKSKLSECVIVKLNSINQSDVNFNTYDTIIIGTPTYGRGVPPLYFQKLISKLTSLRGKKIGLFGSGNTLYGDDFCGALDLIDDLVAEKNEVIFKYKFEGMPRQKDIDEITKLIMEA
jgi:flavodoxin I